MRKKDGFSCWYKAMTAVIRQGTHFYKAGSLETGRGVVANASPLAEPVQRTPGLGNGELRRAFCPYPAARSRAHCLGVGGVALDWAVPTRREDKAAAADCGGRPGHSCRGPPASFRAAPVHADVSAHWLCPSKSSRLGTHGLHDDGRGRGSWSAIPPQVSWGPGGGSFRPLSIVVLIEHLLSSQH